MIDTTPPSITLTGGSIQVVGVGSFFTDPGFSAEDASDGIITDKVNVVGNTIDTSKPGIHEIEYLVADSAGNAAPRTIRTVVVQHTDIPVHAYWKFDETAGTTARIHLAMKYTEHSRTFLALIPGLRVKSEML